MAIINKEDLGRSVNDLMYRSFIIPFYQRNYNWGNKEITQLLQDVYEAFTTDRNKMYYIGNVVVYKRYQQDLYEVIDGQQRLTTLHLIINLFAENKDFTDLLYDSRPEVEGLFRTIKANEDLKEFSANNEKEPNLINFFKAIDSIQNTNLRPSLKDIVSFNSLKEDKDQLNSFIEFILEKVRCIEIEMPQDTDVANYFEIMNNRGVQLQEHEIIKAKLMQRLKDQPQLYTIFGRLWDACSQMDHPIHKSFTPNERNLLFGDHYQSFNECKIEDLQSNPENQFEKSIIEILKDEQIDPNVKGNHTNEDELEEEISFTPIIDFHNFLLHVFKLQYDDTISLGTEHLVKEYDRIADTMKSMDFIKKLMFYRIVFDRFVIKSTIANEQESETMNTQARWLLTKAVMVNQNDGYNKKKRQVLNYHNTFQEAEQERAIKILSMLQVSYRQRKNKNYLQYILSLFDPQDPQSLQIEGRAFNSKLETYALDQFNKLDLSDYFITDEQPDKIKYFKGTNTPHYLFNFIDYLLWKENVNCHEKYNFDFTYRNSVEHHFPQAQKSMLDDDEENSKDTLLHSIGNLCLISKGANSKLNDRSALDKATDKRYSSGDLLPKRKIMYKQTGSLNKWNKDEIIPHDKLIWELLSRANSILK